ncbi:bifunctional folylpolyglutamate synthase/dihydrofolate synthase [Pediococcus stilesii]|uniref:tetrahydrofolate synthase n=1 Tax=Pediococcus stilesii TaxID=331679 RepID=A0A0R2L345_9LACO|nr:cyanophycin synthetase [Pediococcus stilesii]KRN93143.1 folylpolyglutamate synthase [Pediococcus stilesii]
MSNLSFENLILDLNQNMLAKDSERIPMLKRVLKRMGNPDQNFKIIHLAGTNGKGSTGFMLKEILQNAGYKVGYFSSPALLDIREQIQIQSQIIPKKSFVKLYQEIVSLLPSDIKPRDISIFEWFVLIMLQYFAENNVEWAVIEAGLGGEKDATNIIAPPIVTIFTHIDIDHVEILGHSIKEIALNKAGIIKRNTNVFIAPSQHNSALKVLLDISRENDVKSINEVKLEILDVKKVSLFDNIVSIDAKNFSLKNIKFVLNGTFQIDNLATVLTVYDWFFEKHVVQTTKPLVKMMSEINIPGRFQAISQDPLIILDGAHNVDATKRLIETIRLMKPNAKLFFVLGFLKDKNYVEMAKLYDEAATKIITVQPDNPERTLDQSTLNALFKDKWLGSYSNAKQAVSAMEKVVNKNDLIVVSGSFYLVKEMGAALNEET